MGTVKPVSKCFIKPKYIVEDSKKPYYLGSSELFSLSQCYMQSGYVFDKLPAEEEGGMDSFLERLKESLSSTLTLFYPLAEVHLNWPKRAPWNFMDHLEDKFWKNEVAITNIGVSAGGPAFSDKGKCVGIAFQSLKHKDAHQQSFFPVGSSLDFELLHCRIEISTPFVPSCYSPHRGILVAIEVDLK